MVESLQYDYEPKPMDRFVEAVKAHGKFSLVGGDITPEKMSGDVYRFVPEQEVPFCNGCDQRGGEVMCGAMTVFGYDVLRANGEAVEPIGFAYREGNKDMTSDLPDKPPISETAPCRQRQQNVCLKIEVRRRQNKSHRTP